VGGIPPAEFGFPGPQRDRLVAAILSGAKTATTGLHEEHRRLDEPLPRVGDRFHVVDSSGRAVALIETTSVEVRSLASVDDAFARDEGEGFADAAAWRAAHVRFFSSAAMAAALGPPPVAIDDRTLVVCERFRLVSRGTPG
jgi:uncharacterized protein YhfF